MGRGKTIQIFLTDGSPRGIKLADITSNIEQAVFIPRSKMSEAVGRREVSRPGVYFLFGENEDSSRPMAYIGKSRDCLSRIKNHDHKKDFWNYAVLIVSKTESFTQTHIEYLEQLAIVKANEADRYDLENGVNPKKFKVPETLEADLLDNFDTIKILLSTLGFVLFETIVTKQTSTVIFSCNGRGITAKGEYQEDGFVVYKGSTASKTITKGAHESTRTLRRKLLSENVLVDRGNELLFAENHLFKSPSAASALVMGRSSNGWAEWKTKDGKTLDEVIRK